jgi:hypothetical protein
MAIDRLIMPVYPFILAGSGHSFAPSEESHPTMNPITATGMLKIVPGPHSAVIQAILEAESLM